MSDDRPLTAPRNIGAVSARRLAAVGIAKEEPSLPTSLKHRPPLELL